MYMSCTDGASWADASGPGPFTIAFADSREYRCTHPGCKHPGFKGLGFAQNHILGEHHKRFYCPKCERHFQGPGPMTKHGATCASKIYRCVYCAAQTTHIGEMREHMAKLHDERNWKEGDIRIGGFATLHRASGRWLPANEPGPLTFRRQNDELYQCTHPGCSWNEESFRRFSIIVHIRHEHM